MINMSGELQNGDNQYARATASASSQAHADEQSLLILARGGDGAAYAELYRRNAKKVYHVVFRMTKNREDTEDVLQEAHEGIHSLRWIRRQIGVLELADENRDQWRADDAQKEKEPSRILNRGGWRIRRNSDTGRDSRF